jgi:hypothetical protein
MTSLRRKTPGSGTVNLVTLDPGRSHVVGQQLTSNLCYRQLKETEIGHFADPDLTCRTRRSLRGSQEQRQRNVGRHPLMEANRATRRCAAINGGAHRPPRIGMPERRIGTASDANPSG